jgi:DNA-binding MarR family transcriptional regulator
MNLVPPDRCNNTALRKASRKLSLLYDDFVAPSGLKSTQLSLLFEIERRSATPPSLTELATALVMDRSTLGQNLRPLQRDGYVVLSDNPEDGRSKQVALTIKGREKVAYSVEMWAAAQQRFETVFGEREAAALRIVLQAITQSREL